MSIPPVNENGRTGFLSWSLPSYITGHPGFFFLLAILLAAFLLPFNSRVKTVDNVDFFTLDGDSDAQFYEDFKEVFGNDEFFIIAFKAPGGFTASTLHALQDITHELENLDEVEEVTSLANAEDTIGSRDYFEVRSFLHSIPDDVDSLQKLREQAVNNPLYVGNLISSDGNTLGILVRAKSQPEDGGYRKRLIEKTSAILDKYQDKVGRFYLSGWSITNLSLSQYLKADMRVFIPVTFLLILLTTWFFFRNIRLTLIAFANISLCVACTRGFMGLMGISLNNVTSIAIPLAIALSLCDTVHIFSHLERNALKENASEREALADVLRRVILPCLMTTFTTAVGFLSLAVSEVHPIKEFSWIASGAMVFEFLFSFFLVPPLLLACSPDKIYTVERGSGLSSYFLECLIRLIRRYHRWIVGGACLIVLAASWASTQIRVDNNPIECFKDSSVLRRSLNFVETHLAGVGTVDVSLKAAMRDAFKDPEFLLVVDRIQQQINSMRGVDKTVSLVDFIKEMNESFHAEDHHYHKIPGSEELIAQYLLLYDSDDIEDVINTDFDHARIFIRLSNHSSAVQKRLIKEVTDLIGQIEHPGLDIRITGRAVNDVKSNDALIEGQIYSLITAAFSIGMIMFLVFRSVAIGALSLILNFIPVVLNFGIMGAFGIPLDTGTALTSTVALGIAVDDTIHLLSGYQRQRAIGFSIRQAIELAIRVKGQAVLSSSFILCMGFGVLVLSRFVPIIHFGFLSALIMITALISDVIILPSIMFVRRDKGDETEARKLAEGRSGTLVGNQPM